MARHSYARGKGEDTLGKPSTFDAHLPMPPSPPPTPNPDSPQRGTRPHHLHTRVIPFAFWWGIRIWVGGGSHPLCWCTFEVAQLVSSHRCSMWLCRTTRRSVVGARAKLGGWAFAPSSPPPPKKERHVVPKMTQSYLHDWAFVFGHFLWGAWARTCLNSGRHMCSATVGLDMPHACGTQ